MRLPHDAPSFALAFRRFGHDYRLIAAPAAESTGALVGARLIAIGRLPVESIRRKLMPLTPVDETQPLRESRAESLLISGTVLHGLGITSDASHARYTLQKDDGQMVSVDVTSSNAKPSSNWKFASRTAARSLVRPNTGLNCSKTEVPTTVYCSFTAYDDLARTSPRALDVIDRSGTNRLILDLRENGGGDFCEGLKYVVEPLAARRVNRPGHLVVLVGPRTFSAAMSNAAHFRQTTSALLIGEPIGERPNSYQEADEVVLPYTGWTLRYSTRLYRFSQSRDNLIRPDFVVPTSWSDFNRGRDAPLELALTIRSDKAPRSNHRLRTSHASESESCTTRQ
ncbi:hypothetical protein [Sphingomonas sp. UYP23]